MAMGNYLQSRGYTYEFSAFFALLLFPCQCDQNGTKLVEEQGGLCVLYGTGKFCAERGQGQ